MLDFDHCYAAVQSRDTRFDGQFFTAVRTTGIYCRPSCPAVTPLRRNVHFYPTAAAAHLAGYRACKRCRPDATPGSPEWNVRQDVVARAMRLIGDGTIDRAGVEGLAARLGYSVRQINRQLVAEVGAGPLALARAYRAQTARILIETTDMAFTDVAFAAGFKSIRQFNDTIREIFAASPTQMRRSRRNGAASAPGAITLRLAYRKPFQAERIFGFVGARAIPQVESWDGATYSRSLVLYRGSGIVELTPADGYVGCTLWLEDVRDLNLAVGRCRRLMDLDADPDAVMEALGRSPHIGHLARRHHGLRVPGSGDPAELAFRAVLGQQVSVSAARTLAGRIASEHGKPVAEARAGVSMLFPTPEVVAGIDPTTLGMPQSRARALVTLAAALADGDVELGPGVDPAEAREALVALPGIGPWTAAYVSMRALRDPDVFLASDLGVRHALEQAGLDGSPRAAERTAEDWRPWRSYATQLLWTSLAEPIENKSRHEQEVA
jgi:AraC family transcriptional regulator of adaptative response / DNA-3-methyladenine glycosylase II